MSRKPVVPLNRLLPLASHLLWGVTVLCLLGCSGGGGTNETAQAPDPCAAAGSCIAEPPEDPWALEKQLYRRDPQQLLAASDGTYSLGDPKLPFNDTRDPGSRIIFVDSVMGDNESAEIYWWNGSQIVDSDGSHTDSEGREYGKNPLRPNLDAIKPFLVLNDDSRLFTQQGRPAPDVVPQSSDRIWRKAGLSGGYQDWFLFRRGQSHDNYASLYGGKSQDEPTVFAAYGPYEDGRAVLAGGIGGHNGDQPIAQLHVAIFSVQASGMGYLYTHKDVTDINGQPVSAYLEDIHLTGISYPVNTTTVVRSIVSNSFSDGSHNQGYFTSDYHNVVTFDEVIFYRNGYIGDPEQNADPKRTIYSRNIYQGGGARLGHRYLNIISADGASGGPQMRVGAQIENSFILEGYWYTSTHSNKVENPWLLSGGQVGTSAVIRNNVQLVYDYPTPADPDDAGLSDQRANPSWGLRIEGATFGSEVSGNIISGAMLTNELRSSPATFGIYHELNAYDYGAGEIGPINNTIKDNIVYKAIDGVSLAGSSDTTRGITFDNNIFVAEKAVRGTVIDGVSLNNNTFYSSSAPDLDPSNIVRPYDLALAAEQEGWSDPERTLKRYVTEELGLTLLDWEDSDLPEEQVAPRQEAGQVYDPTGIKTFMSVAANMRAGGTDDIPTQGKPSGDGDYPWDERFTGQAVVNWIRAGFGLSPVDASTVRDISGL